MVSSTKLIIRRKRRRLAQKERQAQSQIWTLFLGGAFLLLGVIPAGVVVVSVLLTYTNALEQLPDPRETLARDPAAGATEIYDASGRSLLFTVQDPLGDERRWVSLDELPDYVPQATLIWEDTDFLEQSRTPNNLFSAGIRMWENWLSPQPIGPGSSITARLVRNVIMKRAPDSRPTHDDRALETAYVSAINSRYSPQEVLEWHLNTNYYGHEAYGVEAAAQVYLGKSATELTLDEAAMLAAIPTAPRFNPIDDETAARDRQSDMLRRMLSAGAITQSAFQSVINVTTPVRDDAGQTPQMAPDFALYAREQAESILNRQGRDGAQLVSQGGLRITTTLDLDLYHQTECTLRVHLARMRGETVSSPTTQTGEQCLGAVHLQQQGGDLSPLAVPPDQGAVALIDARTGALLTLNGPADEVRYQPGPTLYPFVYLHGFINQEPNYTPASMLLDVPRPFPGAAEGLVHMPNNPNDQHYGPMSLRDAMGAGLVTPVTQVANTLNLNTVIRDTVERMGISTLDNFPYNLELLQRGGNVSVLDVTYTYSVFAAMGQEMRNQQPMAVRRIENADGELLWQYDEDQVTLQHVPVLDEPVAYLINDILSDKKTRWRTLGQGNVLEMTRDVAVVNGMTSDQVDNWTVGYTPQIVAGVYLGRADRGTTSQSGYALDGAATVWRALMEYVHTRDALPMAEWERPEQIVQTEVCRISGMAPTEACETRDEIFLHPGQFPEEDTYWELVNVNSQTGQRATINTPPALLNTRSYFVPPEEAMDWWRANNKPLPPTEIDTTTRPDMLSSTVILQPSNHSIVGGEVDVRGSMNDENMDYYQLSYGEGTNPSEWINLTEPRESFSPGTTLTTWDTAGLEGTYVLQLLMVREDGTLETGFSQVTVDNVPPSVVLTAGDSDQTFTFPEDETIPLQAEAVDNIRVDRVEFYRNGQFVDTVSEYPFTYDYPISRTGEETFTAVVYDAVGNSSEASLSVEVVREDG